MRYLLTSKASYDGICPSQKRVVCTLYEKGDASTINLKQTAVLILPCNIQVRAFREARSTMEKI